MRVKIIPEPLHLIWGIFFFEKCEKQEKFSKKIYFLRGQTEDGIPVLRLNFQNFSLFLSRGRATNDFSARPRAAVRGLRAGLARRSPSYVVIPYTHYIHCK